MTGFTLVELMVTIAIVAILAAVAFPSFESSLRSNRVATMTNELLGSFSLARSEAIRSTQPTVMCASANGTSCGTDWNQGWIVFVDTDNSGTVNGAEVVTRYVQAHANMNLTANGGPSASSVRFDSRGRPDGIRAMVLQPSTCPSGETLRREMSLTAVGQVSTTKAACA